MGFFNKFLKGLGFEEEGESPKKVKNKEKKEKVKPVKASFDLEQNLEKVNVSKEIKTEIPEPSHHSSALEIIKVKSQLEVQDVIIRIRNGEKVLINMSSLSDQDIVRSLDFLTGAVFALGYSMQKVDDRIYLIQ